MRFPMPAELIASIKSLGIQIADWKTNCDDLVKTQTKLEELIDAQKDLISAKEMEAVAHQKHIEAQSLRIQQLESALASMEPQKPMHAKERESLLKMLIGMAIKGYGHNPKASRSTTAKEIASDLALIGLHMDEDTVRKYLAEAKELLPGDETEQNR